jgi:hypothetical protein
MNKRTDNEKVETNHNLNNKINYIKSVIENKLRGVTRLGVTTKWLEDVRKHCKKGVLVKSIFLPLKMCANQLVKEEIEEEIAGIEGYYDNLNTNRCNYRVVYIR